MRTRARRGFTLVELIVVLIILAIIADITVPAFLRMGQQFTLPTDELRTLLHSAKTASMSRGVPVRVIIDPESGEYRADTLGTTGSGAIATGALDLIGSGLQIETDSARIRFTFMPSGVAFGDSLLVRSGLEMVKVTVDPLTGVFRVEPR